MEEIITKKEFIDRLLPASKYARFSASSDVRKMENSDAFFCTNLC
jgi:hypothetical protein